MGKAVAPRQLLAIDRCAMRGIAAELQQVARADYQRLLLDRLCPIVVTMSLDHGAVRRCVGEVDLRARGARLLREECAGATLCSSALKGGALGGQAENTTEQAVKECR